LTNCHTRSIGAAISASTSTEGPSPYFTARPLFRVGYDLCVATLTIVSRTIETRIHEKFLAGCEQQPMHYLSHYGTAGIGALPVRRALWRSFCSAFIRLGPDGPIGCGSRVTGPNIRSPGIGAYLRRSGQAPTKSRL